MKFRAISKYLVLALAIACVWLNACSKSVANQVLVSVSPSAITLVVTQAFSFTASVTGSTTLTVVWTCDYTLTSTTTTGTTTSTTTSQPVACPADNSYGKISDPKQTTLTYTAPSQLPKVAANVTNITVVLTATADADKKKTGTAHISLDSGIRVGITPATATIAVKSGSVPAEQFRFVASVLNEPGTNVTWLLTQQPSGTTGTFVPTPSSPACTGCGTIDSAGVYTAPDSLPTNATVYVVVSSKTDVTRYAYAIVTLVNPTTAPVSFSGISPTVVPAGGVLQDIYLDAQNLRSSVPISYDGTVVNPQGVGQQLSIIPITSGSCTPSSTVTCPTSIVARLRLNPVQLSQAGQHTITIQTIVSGVITPVSKTLQIVSVRPALVAATPDSFPQGSTATFTVNGGFFGPAGNSDVSIFFNGGVGPFVSSSPRQVALTLSSPQTQSPGLYPVSVANNLASPSTATTNVAIQPTFASPNTPVLVQFPGTNCGTLNNCLPLPGLNGNPAVPSSIAIDSNLGYGIVTEQASNSVQIFQINAAATPPVSLAGIPISVGKAPTSVAIDDHLSPPAPGQHIAVVVNSGDSTLSLVTIPSGNKIGTVDLGSVFSGLSSAPTPYAVGVDPFTDLALVAFSTTNVGLIVDLNPASSRTCIVQGQTPPCAVASVSLNTGATPQIAFEPQLHLAFVTPGGAGLFTVVDLTQGNTPISIEAAPNGAVRTNNVVTIKTSTPHGINPAIGGTVLISGVTPADFNGSFQVSAGGVTDPYTFSYLQTAANESGGGGSVRFGNPDYTFQISNTAVGVAINPATRTAAFADPNATTGQVGFISSLDQTVTSTTLTAGGYNGNPGGAPEIGARYVGFQPYTDVAVSFNPARNEISLLNPGGPSGPNTVTFPYRIIAAIATGQTAINSIQDCPTSPYQTTVDGAMAVDAKTNLVLVANACSNSLSVLDLDPNHIDKPVHINQVQVTSGVTPNATLGQTVVTSASPATIKILGQGFAAGAQVRMDATPIPSTFVSASEMDATIPATPAAPGDPSLAVPRHYALDVLVGGVGSNATDFTVMGVAALNGGCSAGSNPTPAGVAIDEQRKIAVVTNNGCKSISIIDLDSTSATYGTEINHVSVGTSPTGIAVIPRLGLAVVANNGDATASVIDISNPLSAKVVASSPVTVGTSPNGVAIDQGLGVALVANTGSNTVSAIDLNVLFPTASGATPGKLAATSIAVDQEPLAIAINPDDTNGHIAVVTAVQLNGVSQPFGVLDVVTLNGATGTKNSTQSLAGLTATPTGIAFDPAASPNVFYATSTQANAIYTFNPDTGGTQQIRVGINPTSLAYNYQTGTILTVNSGSNTISVVDAQSLKTRATLAIGSQSQFAAAILNSSNLGVIADQANSRVLLFPLPK